MNTRALCAWLVSLWFFFVPCLSFAQAQSTSSSTSATTTSFCSLSVSPQTIPQGASTLLSWKSSTTTTSATISGIGPVAASGALFVAPTQSITFVGTFTGPWGMIHCSVPLYVTAPSSSQSGSGTGVTGGTVGGGSVTYTPPTTGTTPAYTGTPSSQTPGYSGTPAYSGTPGYTPPITSTQPSSPTTPTFNASSLSYPASTGNTSGSGAVSSLVPQCAGGATECTLCDLEKLIQNIINFALGLSIPIAMLLFAMAGILYFTSGANPSNTDRAKKIFSATFMGLLIAISGWLLVQTVMNVFVTGKNFTDWSWNNLQCSPTPYTPTTVTQWLNSVLGSGLGSTLSPTGGGVTSGSGAQCASGKSACSPAALQAVGYTPAQANAMSCIAVTESSGNPQTPNSSSGACGTFQILQSNWNNPNYHGPGCSSATSCNDAACNAQTARIMFNQSGYQPWTGVYPPGSIVDGQNLSGQHWNANAVSCVQMYDPNTTAQLQ